MPEYLLICSTLPVILVEFRKTVSIQALLLYFYVEENYNNNIGVMPDG